MKEGGARNICHRSVMIKKKILKWEDENVSQHLKLRKPEYPGGIELFYKFVGENFKISDEAYENKLRNLHY
jgi:hypothetical protein